MSSIHEEFHDDTLVVVGSCIAGRAWRVHPDGVLTGVTYWQPWEVTGNVAFCPFVGCAVDENPSIPEEWLEHPTVGWGGAVTFQRHGKVKRTPHKPGAMGCCCGWWAYHDLSMTASWGTSMGGVKVVGIIQVYGLMTRGTKGYRAQYADILALVSPTWADEDDEESPRYGLWDKVVDRYDVPVFSTVEQAATAIKGVTT